jgi:hypothetical protein
LAASAHDESDGVAICLDSVTDERDEADAHGTQWGAFALSIIETTRRKMAAAKSPGEVTRSENARLVSVAGGFVKVLSHQGYARAENLALPESLWVRFCGSAARCAVRLCRTGKRRMISGLRPEGQRRQVKDLPHIRRQSRRYGFTHTNYVSAENLFPQLLTRSPGFISADLLKEVGRNNPV